MGRIAAGLLIFAVAWPHALWAQDERPLVVIVPYGKVDARVLRQVAAAVEDTAPVRTSIAPARELPQAAWYAPRKRWRAEKLLDALDADLPAGAWKVVAVTNVEISTTKEDIPDWGIGGLGNMGGRSCVVSTYLIRKHTKGKDAAKIAERTRKLAVHEFGHTLGLPHCGVVACVMQDAKGKLIQSLDTGSETWCGRCRKQLPNEVLTPP